MIQKREELRDFITKVIEEQWVNAVHGDTVSITDVVDKIMAGVEVYCGDLAGLIEIRASLQKFTVQPGKEIQIQAACYNEPDNVVRLARMGQSLTLLGLELDLEAAAEANKNGAAKTEDESIAEGDQDASQLDIEKDLNAEGDGSDGSENPDGPEDEPIENGDENENGEDADDEVPMNKPKKRGRKRDEVAV